MDDPRPEEAWQSSEPGRLSRTERRTAWERALNGPPINPNSDLIYHDEKKLRSRHD